jgi:hypothetical protein
VPPPFPLSSWPLPPAETGFTVRIGEEGGGGLDLTPKPLAQILSGMPLTAVSMMMSVRVLGVEMLLLGRNSIFLL